MDKYIEKCYGTYEQARDFFAKKTGDLKQSHEFGMKVMEMSQADNQHVDFQYAIKRICEG